MLRRNGRSPGFSLIEMLIVIIIMLIMMAVAVPNFMQFMRLRKIRGATRQVAAELEKARYRAINRNVNLGVTFVVLDDSTYRYVVEDDQVAGDGTDWFRPSAEPWANMVDDTNPLSKVQAGPLRTLPAGIEFDPACPTQTGGGGGTMDGGFRFNRMGRPCAFTIGTCGDAPGGFNGDNTFVFTDNMGVTICMWEPATRLRNWVIVSSGGRVRTGRAFEVGAGP